MKGALRLLALWVGVPLTLVLLIYLAVWARYRISVLPAWDAAVRSQAMVTLRAAIDGQDKPATLPALALPGPLWVTVYRAGNPLLRLRQTEKTAGEAIAKAAQRLRKDPRWARLGVAERGGLRIKVDLLAGRGPLVTSIPLFFAKGLVPGLDGLALDVGAGRQAYLLPDELYKTGLLAGYQPFFFMHEFKTGLDLKSAVDLLASRLELTIEAWRKAPRHFTRFRVRSFIEAHDRPGKALPVVRQRVPVERIDRATVRRAVVHAADYVLRQLRPDGRFHYIYYPLADQHDLGADYSLPRHAGTTWFLSLAYQKLKKPRFRDAAKRAIEYLAARAVPLYCRRPNFACVGSNSYADLGSAGLAVVAIMQYQEATGDRRYEPLGRQLGEFIISMQKPNGDFCHQYHPKARRKNCKDILLYYTGEAALALARLRQVTKDPRYVAPLRRALDFLVGAKYDFFLGQFFISEDHWTCIAAEAAYPVVQRPEYLEFCREFASLNRRTQITKDEALGDLWGGFGITPFFIPHNTPVGSRSEANVATYLLSKHLGRPDPLVLDTVRRAMRYLVDQQIRPESAYLLPNPGAAVGGLTQTPIRAQIRIDYVQHAAAAMVRALPLIPEKPWP